jgi:hypothetical protein
VLDSGASLLGFQNTGHEGIEHTSLSLRMQTDDKGNRVQEVFHGLGISARGASLYVLKKVGTGGRAKEVGELTEREKPLLRKGIKMASWGAGVGHVKEALLLQERTPL